MVLHWIIKTNRLNRLRIPGRGLGPGPRPTPVWVKPSSKNGPGKENLSVVDGLSVIIVAGTKWKQSHIYIYIY